VEGAGWLEIAWTCGLAGTAIFQMLEVLRQIVAE
jgi:hypothetical protein